MKISLSNRLDINLIQSNMEITNSQQISIFYITENVKMCCLSEKKKKKKKKREKDTLKEI